ncbi:hypothetical protein HDV00_012329 [Rhizophlyctis rosea]|nr:hypothetical protein HDV00_012329 [Rhizophlyctis rosea]
MFALNQIKDVDYRCTRRKISALKAKLSRSEVAIKTLERTVESKNEENTELARIYDGLVAQLDQSMACERCDVVWWIGG